MANVLWTPQPKQAVFQSRWEWEALYGGAAGGGKSDALVAEALRQVHVPHYKALILRKTYPQLSELMEKAERIYPRAFPRARYNDAKHTWTFPGGAKVVFGSMQHPKDRVNYQGRSFDYIAFDELTHFTWEEYSYLFSRCRANGPGTRSYIRATANPGGVGHGWVKERFISAAPPMTTMWQVLEYPDQDGKLVKIKKARIFVPATVYDNDALRRNSPEYIANLASMPTADRKALLEGDWDSFVGQVFTEWRNDPAHYEDRKNTHVIAPFKIPREWPVWCGLDWGYSKPFSVGWYAVDQDRRLYRIRELYGCTGDPDTGLKMEPGEVAARIRRIEGEDVNLKGRRITRVGDPAIWGSDGTESIGALFERERIYFEKGDHDRINGKMQLHHRLAFDEEGTPMFYVFNTCRHFIRTIPALVYSQSDVEDVDTKQEDHIYDECRYICMKNPIGPRKNTPPERAVYNPLDLEEPVSYGRYEWYRRN